MGVDKQARKDYEEGQAPKLGVVDRSLRVDIPGNHPNTPAYYKARDGEQLDADKKSEGSRGVQRIER